MLRGAQTRIQDWWAQAYDGVLGERFRLEAQASLPLVGGGAGVEEVCAGVRVHRLRLRFDLGVGNGGCRRNAPKCNRRKINIRPSIIKVL